MPSLTPISRCPSSCLRVIEAFGETEELLADPHGLLELGPIDVQGRQPAQDWKELRELALRLAKLERPLVRPLRLRRVALRRHQDPGEARLQQDLLEQTLLVGRCRREHFEKIRDERRCLVIPAASVVEQPQTVGELSELLEVPLATQ